MNKISRVGFADILITTTMINAYFQIFIAKFCLGGVQPL